MPRSKTGKSRKKKGSSSSSSSNNEPSSRFSSKELFDAAEHAMHQDADRAIALYTAALMTPPSQRNMDTCFILEKRAQAHVANGHSQAAFRDFEQAYTTLREQIQHLRPGDLSTEDRSRLASFHLYMGQLSGGKDAISQYQQGIELLETCLINAHLEPETIDNQEQWRELQQQLSLLCCSAAEVYLTDMCDEPTAEKSCQALVERALNVSTPPTMDALQTAASLALSQCQTSKAIQYMDQVYHQHLKEPCLELAKLVGLVVSSDNNKKAKPKQNHHTAEEAAPAVLELNADTDPLPSFEFRCQTAKLLLECSVDDTGAADWCPEAAVAVLGSLLAENDEVIEIWILTGDAFGLLKEGESDKANQQQQEQQQQLAAYYYEHALEMLQDVQTSLQHALDEAVSEEEEEQLQQEFDQVTCQLQEVQQKLIDNSSSNDTANSGNQTEPMKE